jgi:hypothetical protein
LLEIEILLDYRTIDMITKHSTIRRNDTFVPTLDVMVFSSRSKTNIIFVHEFERLETIQVFVRRKIMTQVSKLTYILVITIIL